MEVKRMKQRKIEFSVKNIFFYFIGFFILGLGINLMLRSNLGAGAWDATNFNLNDMVRLVWPTVTYGTTSLFIGISLFIVVFLYRLDWKLFAMVFPMLLIAATIDFWDLLILNNFHPDALNIRLFLFVSGGLLIPLGLSCVVASNFPGTVFDEFTLMMREVTKVDNFGKVRLGVEITGIILALVFGLIAGVGLGAISIGTLIMAVVLGPIMNFYLKLLGVTKSE
jgi:uncharacterized membrane protein YczE